MVYITETKAALLVSEGKRETVKRTSSGTEYLRDQLASSSPVGSCVHLNSAVTQRLGQSASEEERLIWS